MAKASDIRRDALKALKVDGRTREGRQLRARAQEAKEVINEWQWRPLIPLPDGLYHVDGSEITQDDIMRADFNDWIYIAPRRNSGAIAFTHQEPTGDERTQAIFDNLGCA
jgi:hypothetical protein